MKNYYYIGITGCCTVQANSKKEALDKARNGNLFLTHNLPKDWADIELDLDEENIQKE